MPESAPVYRFGRFSVDTREQQLTKDGAAIPITPKVFDTLVTFLRNSGRLLTKDDLLQAIWPDTAVEEANLTVNVSTLRRLLAVKGQPPCIETVPRRGYRFVLPVDVENVAEPRPTVARSDKPATARAQELYSRANQAAYEADHWETARDLYQACVEEDPDFAPAWAQLARCHALIAKFTATRPLRDFARAQAETTFARALALNESLPLTQRLYAQFEVDLGRASDAAVRLVRLIQQSGPDAAVFAGLVHALRFCGLLRESRAAHERARALDPTILTSVAHTCWLLGEYDIALRETTGDIGYMSGLALASLGRESDAIAALARREAGEAARDVVLRLRIGELIAGAIRSCALPPVLTRSRVLRILHVRCALVPQPRGTPSLNLPWRFGRRRYLTDSVSHSFRPSLCAARHPSRQIAAWSSGRHDQEKLDRPQDSCGIIVTYRR